MKNGFTLLELLAVIVILAVIALITTPMILGVIETSKVEAAKASATGYIESIEVYIGTSKINNKTNLKANEKYNVTEITTMNDGAIEALNDLVEIKGEEPSGTEDYITLDEQYKVKEGKLTFNEYVVIIGEGEMTVTKIGEKVLIEDIILNLTEETIERGNKVKIKTTFKPSNTTNKKLIYKSNNEEIVKVSEKGEIEAVGIGEGIVTVISEENSKVKKEIKITVIAPEYATSVRIEKEDKELYVGDTIQLTGILEPNDVTSKILTWTSSDIEVASISDAGLVTGKKVGTTIITATTKNNVSATIEIIVTKGNPTKEEASETDTHKGIIYLDPTNLSKKCTKELAENNLNENGTPTEIKAGCMKWYIYSEDDDSYTMILDHNTTAIVEWNTGGNRVSYESSGLYPAIQELKTTSGWVVEPRIISAEEINAITGKIGWSNVGSDYYLDTLTGSGKTFNASTRSKYYWLFNNLVGCKTSSDDYGCTVEDNNRYKEYGVNQSNVCWGYWTSSNRGNGMNSVWYITRYGALNYETSNYPAIGIRPVIKISKSIIG